MSSASEEPRAVSLRRIRDAFLSATWEEAERHLRDYEDHIARDAKVEALNELATEVGDWSFPEISRGRMVTFIRRRAKWVRGG